MLHVMPPLSHLQMLGALENVKEIKSFNLIYEVTSWSVSESSGFANKQTV